MDAAYSGFMVNREAVLLIQVLLEYLIFKYVFKSIDFQHRKTIYCNNNIKKTHSEVWKTASSILRTVHRWLLCAVVALDMQNQR